MDGERSDTVLEVILHISRWMILFPLEKDIRKYDWVLPALSQIVNNTNWGRHKTLFITTLKLFLEIEMQET